MGKKPKVTSFAEVVYGKWVEVQKYVNHAGEQLPRWNELLTREQEAWIAATELAMNEGHNLK